MNRASQMVSVILAVQKPFRRGWTPLGLHSLQRTLHWSSSAGVLMQNSYLVTQ